MKPFFFCLFVLGGHLLQPPLFADTSKVFTADAALPGEFEVKIGKTKIRGWRDRGELSDPSVAFPWFSEGFIYRPKETDPNQFELVAWSEKGRAGEIMSAAEEKILEMVMKRSPVGTAYSGLEKSKRQKKNYPKGRTVIDSRMTE